MGAVDLVAVGDVMLDVRVDAETLKGGGDVHGRVLLQPGGTSANAAVWAAWAGASSRVLGRVGDDLAGRSVRGALAEHGVEVAVTVDPEAPTGTMLVVHEPGERSMVADRGANARLAIGDLPETIEAGAVLVSGYLLLQEPGHDAALAALARAVAPWVAVDAASWPLVEAFGADRFFEETTAVTALLANEREAEVLTGRTGVDSAARLGERYRLAAVKMDRRGAAICVDGSLSSAPAEPVVEVDPTGAGDAFDGVLLARLAHGDDPVAALVGAGHAGALAASSTEVWPEPTVHRA
ncbi:MAG TPA: PfkB family carbohydrate kinase [Actinomycetota bacterium]|nr:PfkB family carbohydrate kinase [Actinomycetota bacterium]